MIIEIKKRRNNQMNCCIDYVQQRKLLIYISSDVGLLSTRCLAIKEEANIDGRIRQASIFQEDGKKEKKKWLGCKEKKLCNVDSLHPCKTDLMKRNSFPCTLRRHRLANTCPHWILSIRKKCALRRMTLAAVEH